MTFEIDPSKAYTRPEIGHFITIEDWFGDNNNRGTFVGLIKEIKHGQYKCIGRYKTSVTYIERFIMMCDPTLKLIDEETIAQIPNLSHILTLK